jgi:chromosome segregation ATPase
MREVNDRIGTALSMPTSALKEIRELQARIADLETHNRELIAGIFAGQVREQNLEARIAELTEALALANATLSGANMDRAAVERKVRAALKPTK